MKNAIIYTIRDVLLTLVDSLLGWVRTVSGSRPGGGVLIVRGDAIGDFIVWLDAARMIRHHFKGREIVLVCNKLVASFAQKLPFFDRVIGVDLRKFRNSPRYRYMILWELLGKQYQVVLHPAYSRYARFSDVESIVHVARATRKYGFISKERTGWRKSWSDRWYTDRIQSDGVRNHELTRNRDFIRYLGYPDYQETIPFLPRDELGKNPVELQPYYVLFPGAGLPIRQWPLKKFAILASRIYDRTGMTGIICGGPGDKALGEQLVEKAGVPLENWAGKTSLLGLGAVIQGARFLVSNETSAVHMAVATRTPSVCLLGGGDFERFVPYPEVDEVYKQYLPVPVFYHMECFNCAWNCKYEPEPDGAFPCVSKIDLEAVWAAVVKQIQHQQTAFSADLTPQ